MGNSKNFGQQDDFNDVLDTTPERHDAIPTWEDLAEELAMLVDQGYLNLGVDEFGTSIFWPTPKGIEELGMTAVVPASAS